MSGPSPGRLSPGARIVALMCGAEILCMAGFATYPALLPVLRAGWGLSNTAAGFVGGILFFGYVGSVPVLTGLTEGSYIEIKKGLKGDETVISQVDQQQ